MALAVALVVGGLSARAVSGHRPCPIAGSDRFVSGRPVDVPTTANLPDRDGSCTRLPRSASALLLFPATSPGSTSIVAFLVLERRVRSFDIRPSDPHRGPEAARPPPTVVASSIRVDDIARLGT